MTLRKEGCHIGGMQQLTAVRADPKQRVSREGTGSAQGLIFPQQEMHNFPTTNLNISQSSVPSCSLWDFAITQSF